MKPRIAVFDPSPNLLTLFQAVLTRNGYAVYPYNYELTDIDQVERIHPRLLILGYFRGYSQAETEVIFRLRARPILRQIPILVCSTGSVELPDVETAAPISVFPKPFNIADLLAWVKDALQPHVGV